MLCDFNIQNNVWITSIRLQLRPCKEQDLVQHPFSIIHLPFENDSISSQPQIAHDGTPTNHHLLNLPSSKSWECCLRWSSAHWGRAELVLAKQWHLYQIRCDSKQVKNRWEVSFTTLWQTGHIRSRSCKFMPLFTKFNFVGILSNNILHNKKDTFDGIRICHINLNVSISAVPIQ